MNNLVNLTPFSATALPSLDRAGEELLLMIVSARFSLTPGKKDSPATFAIHEEQPPVVISDEHWGDPASSSLRYEGQTAYEKLGTDIQLAGHAWKPPGERRVTESWVGVQVGAQRMAALVFGDRRWVKGLLLGISYPLPFERIPIRYERCFGGPAAPGLSTRVIQASERNPVGCGLVLSGKTVDGQPLPNFELPSARITDSTDYPLPAGFGPVARHWQPRRSLGGTYDDAWVRKRAPYWPSDFDPRFFSSAPAGLCAVPHLVGGERVSIVGAHPDGNIQFLLPTLSLPRFGGHPARDVTVHASLCGARSSMRFKSHDSDGHDRARGLCGGPDPAATCRLRGAAPRGARTDALEGTSQLAAA